MSDRPLRPQSAFGPSSYDSIPPPPPPRRSSTLPKHHVHLLSSTQEVPSAPSSSQDLQRPSTSFQPRLSLTGRAKKSRKSMVSHNATGHNYLLPAVITPAPFQTRGGMFVPGTPAVYVPSRPMVEMSDRQVAEESENDLDASCSSCCDSGNVRRTLQTVLLGQALSLCLCGTGVSSELLARSGFNAPAAQNFFNYFLLFFVYGLVLICRRGNKNLVHVLRRRGWKYLILAFIDVQANYLIVHAYQYTNLTSIQILDCSTIPVVMVLSWLFLSVRYLVLHLIGVAVCLCGIGLIIVADAQSGRGTEGGADRLLGDCLCLGGALLYGAANVTEEFLVKQYDRFEYLGLVGLFGTGIAGVQLAVLERDNLNNFHWNWAAFWEYALYTGCMFVFYSMVSIVMKKASALMFNLSVLTADFYTLLAGLFLFSYSFNILYLISFVIVITGAVTFSLKKTEEKSRQETNLIARVFCFCCPWILQCCDECRPRQAYTVRDAENERSSIGTPQSDTTPSTN